MKQLDLFRKVEPESDLEKLESDLYNTDKYSLDYREFCLHEAMEDIVSDCRDKLDIIDFDIDSAIESGDKERLSQLVELRKSYIN